MGNLNTYPGSVLSESRCLRGGTHKPEVGAAEAETLLKKPVGGNERSPSEYSGFRSSKLVRYAGE
jgi:hypothetical protein